MIDKKHITGIILSGGKSSRMGTDKGFLLLEGKPFVQYSLEALKPIVSNLMIACLYFLLFVILVGKGILTGK